MEPGELANAIIALQAWAAQHSSGPEPVLPRKLRELFGREPAELPIVTQSLQPWDRPNLQLAIDAWLADREFELFGLPPMHGYRAGLAELVRGGGPAFLGLGELTGTEHITVALGEHESVTCVQSGLWLVAGEDGPVVLMLRGQEMGDAENLTFEAMATERERAERVFADLRRSMSERNVYRGRVLELQPRHFHEDEGAPLTVRTLPQVRRDQIVLPEDVLERIERQTFGIARHAERLRASGRHLRRGLLLHGPPGVGKTLTAMYLAARMPERTVVILTGRALSVVQTCVDLATALQPAMVVLEDVDLVAMDRAYESTNAVLFELLNAMDGLDEDHDVLFVLTTNRVDRLEPALAARPGRIDQAVELPLPDADGRRRLIELYGAGLGLELPPGDPLVGELEGTTPAFIRELLRRAALLAADDGGAGAIRVGPAHLHGALRELRAGGDLTRTLLGAQPRAETPDDVTARSVSRPGPGAF